MFFSSLFTLFWERETLKNERCSSLLMKREKKDNICVIFRAWIFLVSGFLNQMQQLFIRKLTYASFRDKRVCAIINQHYHKWSGNTRKTCLYIYIYMAYMLQLEAHSLLTSCVMNTLLSTTNLIRLFKRFNCSLVRVWTCSC